MIRATCARVGGESGSAASTSLLPRHEAEVPPRFFVEVDTVVVVDGAQHVLFVVVVEGATEKCSPCSSLRKFVTDAVVLLVVYANGATMLYRCGLEPENVHGD